ncbi:hypothetical protein [Glaciecola sp. 1036]|uniref:hypothetical protein n=1 Tax=Alteromonadaceae TaxID=72275 RepID=UPI003CFFFA71
MADPSGGFLEFAIKAWHHRDHIMQAKNAAECTRRIYNYYNYFEGIEQPDWCELLTSLETEFLVSRDLIFYFQGLNDIHFRGDHLSYMAYSLRDLLNNDSAALALLQDIGKDSYQHSYFDKTTRRFRAPRTAKELVKSDPAFMLDQFLWNRTPRSKNMAMYRIYVTPQSLFCPKVFTAIVRKMNSQVPSTFKMPSSAKMLIPGPGTSKRADKIVLYCQDKDELDGGVEFLRLYQKKYGYAALFESLIPRSTKPVSDLQGVAVTPQPSPESFMMGYAGIDKDKVKGISFGMSRAAIIYLAMNDNYRKGDSASIQFLRDCHKIARIANIDIHLNRADLTV